MTAVVQQLNIEQGTTFVFGMTLNDTTTDVDGNVIVVGPKDLTGATAAMQIRKTQGDTVQWEGTTANGKIILGRLAYGASPAADDLTNGRLMVIISDEETDALTTKASAYDLELIESNPRSVVRLAKGPVVVDPNITQHISGDALGTNDATLA